MLIAWFGTHAGIPKLLVDKDDPSKGTVILSDGKKIEARIERLPKEEAHEEEW